MDDKVAGANGLQRRRPGVEGYSFQVGTVPTTTKSTPTNTKSKVPCRPPASCADTPTWYLYLRSRRTKRLPKEPKMEAIIPVIRPD